MQSKHLELLFPFGGSIAQSFHADATREAAFDRRLDEGRREERKRNGHIDLTHAAFLPSCDLVNAGHGARQEFVEPPAASDERFDQARTPFDPDRTDCAP
jgi:hypothetical protein